MAIDQSRWRDGGKKEGVELGNKQRATTREIHHHENQLKCWFMSSLCHVRNPCNRNAPLLRPSTRYAWRSSTDCLVVTLYTLSCCCLTPLSYPIYIALPIPIWYAQPFNWTSRQCASKVVKSWMQRGLSQYSWSTCCHAWVRMGDASEELESRSAP